MLCELQRKLAHKTFAMAFTHIGFLAMCDSRRTSCTCMHEGEQGQMHPDLGMCAVKFVVCDLASHDVLLKIYPTLYKQRIVMFSCN
jgi:hypothetical protein